MLLINSVIKRANNKVTLQLSVYGSVVNFELYNFYSSFWMLYSLTHFDCFYYIKITGSKKCVNVITIGDSIVLEIRAVLLLESGSAH